MTAKKFDVHYMVEDHDEVIATTADEAAEIIQEEQGPNVKILSVLPVEENADEPPDDYEDDSDDDDGYGHAV